MTDKNKKNKIPVILGAKGAEDLVRQNKRVVILGRKAEDLVCLNSKPFAQMTRQLARILFFLLFFFTATSSHAITAIKEVNYFASLRSAETNVRAGPGQNYPIKFTFKIRGIPMQVVSEYDNWSEIKDYEGQSGWVTNSLLTKKRTLMVKTDKAFINLHSKNNEKSHIIYRLENNVIGDYIKCVEDWCGIKINKKKGWVQKKELWGAD